MTAPLSDVIPQFGGNAGVILRSLSKGNATSSMLVDAVYGHLKCGGPKSAQKSVIQCISNMRPRLRTFGWLIVAEQGKPGYSLVPLSGFVEPDKCGAPGDMLTAFRQNLDRMDLFIDRLERLEARLSQHEGMKVPERTGDIFSANERNWYG